MKTTTNNITILLGLAVSFLFGSALAGNTIVDIASGNNDFDILTRALKRTGLVETLDSAGPFTVLAPTDRAFRNLFNELGLDGLPDVDTDTLTTILLYHVISGKVYSNDLRDGSVETVGGSNVQVEVRNGRHRIFFNNAEVTTADIRASNGVIHVIDAVLVPPSDRGNSNGGHSSSLPTLVELVAGDNRFNTLVRCLDTAGLVDAVADGEDLTIFAPTNAAFSTLFQSLGIDGCGDVAKSTLQEILLYHVLGEVVLAEDLSDGERLTTLQGSTVHIDFRNNGRRVFVDNARILEADKLASNGVVHVINAVITP